jgi:hypothetical protein
MGELTHHEIQTYNAALRCLESYYLDPDMKEEATDASALTMPSWFPELEGEQ